MRTAGIRVRSRLVLWGGHRERDEVKKTICYCFNFGEDDIRTDVERNKGRSLILEKIVAEKQKGVCQCVTKHPEHR